MAGNFPFSACSAAHVLHVNLFLFWFLHFQPRAMSSVVDSEAHFDLHLSELGLSDPFINALKNGGIRTLSHLAFSIGQPNQVLSNDDVTNFLQGLLGRAPSLVESSSTKRLTFEAQTYVVATLRQGLEQQDEAVPRRVAHAERTTRMSALQLALSGVSISGELDPAHILLDKATAMYEQNIVKYIEPSACISRAFEVQGKKESRELSLEKGSLVLKAGSEKLTSPTDTELKVHYAMQRRALAFQFANLMSYAQHNERFSFLVDALHREAPPEFQRPSLAQLLQCDRAAWTRLASSLSTIRQRLMEHIL